jgi:hypothetical protein
MPREQVEFRFPDEEDDSGVEIEIEPSSAEEIDITGKKYREGGKSRSASQPELEEEVEVETEEESAEAEIEVVDDTPPEDRGREPSEPPEEVTEDELESYSERVRKRMKHFSKGYHDERRAKEAAIRERDELERVTRHLYEQLQNAQGESTKSRGALLEQAKQAANAELESARREYKAAYEAGESNALLEAQEKLTSAKFRVEQLSRANPATSLQEDSAPVKDTQEQRNRTPQPQVDPKAVEWQKTNTWFGTDEEMTAYALGLHQKLVKSGVDPQSESYYEQLNARVKKTFPEYFTGMEVEEPPQQEKQKPNKTNVVAPATRSTSPKTIRLTQSQVSIARRLGVPLETYAKQLAADARKADGR